MNDDPQQSSEGSSTAAAGSARGIWIGVAVALAIAVPFFIFAFMNLDDSGRSALRVENLEKMRCEKRFSRASTTVDLLNERLGEQNGEVADTRTKARKLAAQIEAKFPSQTLPAAEYARYLSYKNRWDRAVAENGDAVDAYNATLRKYRKARRRLDRLGLLDC